MNISGAHAAQMKRANWVGVALALSLILAGGAYARLWHLWPPAVGVTFAPDTDEGAYVFTALRLLQGDVPYRDLFATLPPAGIYWFAAVLAPFGHPWGSIESFMAIRYLSVLQGLLTLLTVYGIGRRLGGQGAGLLAAGVLALDGIVMAQDRRAMLETPMNLFSALAVLTYLEAEQRRANRRPWLILAGACSAIAVLFKTPALVVPFVLGAITVVRRRWVDLMPLLGGGLAAGLLLAGPSLLLAGREFIEQVYLFQMGRPPDGTLAALSRLREMWGYSSSWLTVRMGLLGAALALCLTRRQERWTGWVLVTLWASGTLALILSSRSYWATYFSQLAVPLAILAGGVNCALVAIGRRQGSLMRRWALAALLVAFSIWAAGHAGAQYAGVKQLLAFRKPAFAAVMQYLQVSSSPADAVLATDPLYAMLASRPLARGNGRPYLADSYGGMLYRNQMEDKKDVFTIPEDVVAIFHRPPAQDEILAALENAQFVVVDKRARRQWAPATLARVVQDAVPVLTMDDVTLWERLGER